jgi:hypothetical protein
LIVKQKTHNKAMLALMAIFFMLAASSVFSPFAVAKENREIGHSDVQGKVLSIRTNIFGGGMIEVKSDQTEKVYIFHVGMGTVYIPQRYPVVGETIKVSYFDERGKLKAARVQIIQGLQ